MEIHSLKFGTTFGLMDIFYPVGSYYETSDGNFDPNKEWGGTWVKDTDGLVLVSEGSGGAAGISAPPLPLGEEGGEYTHQLTVNEMPAHRHTVGISLNVNQWGWNLGDGGNYKVSIEGKDTISSSVGGNSSHNNMQPYVVVCRWHRTA